jgi:hypothetical protein
MYYAVLMLQLLPALAKHFMPFASAPRVCKVVPPHRHLGDNVKLYRFVNCVYDG